MLQLQELKKPYIQFMTEQQSGSRVHIPTSVKMLPLNGFLPTKAKPQLTVTVLLQEP
jgi:hypothetical protein